MGTTDEGSAAVGLICPTCPDVTWTAAAPTWHCTRCGGPLELRYPLRVATTLAGPGGDGATGHATGLWRYLPWLPSVGAPVQLGEPITPLLQATVGSRRVLLKRESALPTGSFKDRGAAVFAAWLRATGIRRVVEDSSGNAGASLAAYGVAAGVRTRIVAPATASAAELLQIRLTGAEIETVPGPRIASTERALEIAASGWFYASHLWSPVFLAGAATFAWELWEQLDRSAPDAVVVPVGGGTLLLGVARGFASLRAAGLIAAEPRLYGVQVQACDPLARAFASGAMDVEPVVPSPSMADGIVLGDPPRGAEIVAEVRRTAGAIVAVDDSASWAALRALARQGTFVEPTSAVAAAGCARLIGEGRLGAGERVVLAGTGSGLKAVDRIMAHLG